MKMRVLWSSLWEWSTMVVKGTNPGVGSKNASCNFFFLSLFSKSQNQRGAEVFFLTSHGPVNSAARSQEWCGCFVAALKSRILLPCAEYGKQRYQAHPLEHWEPHVLLGAAGNHQSTFSWFIIIFLAGRNPKWLTSSTFHGEMGGAAVHKVDIAVLVFVEWFILAFSIRDILSRAASQKHNRVRSVLSAPGFVCVFS